MWEVVQVLMLMDSDFLEELVLLEPLEELLVLPMVLEVTVQPDLLEELVQGQVLVLEAEPVEPVVLELLLETTEAEEPVELPVEELEEPMPFHQVVELQVHQELVETELVHQDLEVAEERGVRGLQVRHMVRLIYRVCIWVLEVAVVPVAHQVVAEEEELPLLVQLVVMEEPEELVALEVESLPFLQRQFL